MMIRSAIRQILHEAKGWWEEKEESEYPKLGDIISVIGYDELSDKNVHLDVFNSSDWKIVNRDSLITLMFFPPRFDDFTVCSVSIEMETDDPREPFRGDYWLVSPEDVMLEKVRPGPYWLVPKNNKGTPILIFNATVKLARHP